VGVRDWGKKKKVFGLGQKGSGEILGWRGASVTTLTGDEGVPVLGVRATQAGDGAFSYI